MAMPVYLRDLSPEQQREWMNEINGRPELKAAFDAGDDIVVGDYRLHAVTLDENDDWYRNQLALQKMNQHYQEGTL